MSSSLLGERHPDVMCAVITGPLLRSTRGSSLPARAFASILSTVAPRLRLPASIDPTAISSHPESQEAYRTDPLIPKTLSARMAKVMLQAVLRVQDLAPAVRVPLMILHAEEDRLCPVGGSREFHARLTVPGSEIRTYPRLRHEILYEPDRRQVLEDLEAFIRRHLAPRAAA